MPQQVRRTHAGWDDYGHHWENPGDVIEVSDSQASRLLAQPAVPLYTLVEPGATKEVEHGDPNQANDDSESAKHTRRTAIESTPQDPRTNAPDDNRPESPNTPGSGKADTLHSSGGAADAVGSDGPQGKQADTLDGAPNDVNKTVGRSGRNTSK